MLRWVSMSALLLFAGSLAACQSPGLPASAAPSEEGYLDLHSGSVDAESSFGLHTERAANTPRLAALAFDTGTLPPTEPEPQDAGDSDRRLIYSGMLRLAVSDFEATARRARELTTELGGYLQSLTDDRLTLRIPSDRWEEAFERFEQLGSVVGRQLQVQDVTEEFTDLEIELTNARALRERLEVLLQRADDIEAALKIETELTRVRTQIERLEGRLRFLGNRVAFGTLTLELVRVAAAARAAGLPFPWLHELGVVDLLGLEGSDR